MQQVPVYLNLAVAFCLLCSCQELPAGALEDRTTINPTPPSSVFTKGCSQLAQRGQLTEGQEVRVSYISDGDTFTGCLTDGTELKVKVRVFGIDCPESHHNDKCERDGRQGRKNCDEQIPLGQEATKRALSLLKNQVVRLESAKGDGRFKSDGFDRILAYVRLEDQHDFGKEMIVEGFCEDFGWKFKHPRQDDYKHVSP